MKPVKKYEICPEFPYPATITENKTSISTILSMLTEPFDQNTIAEKTFTNNFNNPNSQYYNMTVTEIIANWEEKGNISRYYGKKNDEYIGIVLNNDEYGVDLFYLDNDVDGDKRLKTQIDSFNEYINDLPDTMLYVTREKSLNYNINGEHNIIGRFDALFFDTEKNKWIIIDWKTNNVIDTKPNKWTEKLLGPAKDFPALSWYTYTIQLYFYKIALIEGGYLPEGTTYDDIEVYIVNLPGKPFEDTGKLYKVFTPAFEFDKDKLDGIFTFGIKKNILLNKKNGSNN